MTCRLLDMISEAILTAALPCHVGNTILSSRHHGGDETEGSHLLDSQTFAVKGLAQAVTYHKTLCVTYDHKMHFSVRNLNLKGEKERLMHVLLKHLVC